jgi:dolichyl-phosphate beta-glucosyltransferase
MAKIVIVVPCYNEAQRLDADRYCDFLRRSQETQLCLVNDGSTDGTAEVLSCLQRRLPGRCHVRHLPRNTGKAEAVRQGMLTAFGQRPDFVGYWDADLATPLEAVPQLAEALRRRPCVQVAMGSRVALLGRRIERRWQRRVAGRVFATAAAWVLNVPVYDTQCGAKLFRAGPDVEAVFQRPFESRWVFDVEILARLAGRQPAGGLADAAYEVPLDEWRDVAGSKLRARDFLRSVGELWVIHRAYAVRRLQRRARKASSLHIPAPISSPGQEIEKAA